MKFFESKCILFYINGKQCKNTQYIFFAVNTNLDVTVMYESEPGNGTIYSVAKSAVFSWKWATLTMLSRVVFMSAGLNDPDNKWFFYPLEKRLG